MKILLIDNTEAQLRKAIKATEANGWEYVTCDTSMREPGYCNNTDWIEMVDGVDGVVTDLMWDHSDYGEKPMGLLVVIHSLCMGKPVVICTNASDYSKGHHGEDIGFINDGYRTSVRGETPFGWEERKDWERALNLLAEKMKK